MSLKYTEKDIEKVNGISIIEYARDLGYEVKKFSPNTYKTEGYGGLYIHAEGHKWNWFSHHTGGGVIQFAMMMQNLSWLEAVEQLLGSNYEIQQYTRTSKESWKREAMILPEKNNTYKHAIAYLIQTRGIDKETVYEFIQAKKIYENKHKSCVFVGYDENQKARYASIRSTNTTGQSFKMDVSNSDKRYCCCREGKNQTLCVFEAPIDLMSYLSFEKLHGEMDPQNHMLALGGLSTLALQYYLEVHPEINTLVLCLDHDQVGHFACQTIREEYEKKGVNIMRHCPERKDFNEDLIAAKAKQVTNVVHTPYLCGDTECECIHS